MFSGKNRTINVEDEIELTSVGIDVGSSTSHLVFSRLVMQRRATRYVVAARELLFESAMLLTPYARGLDIDAAVLQTFVEDQYERAELATEDVDTGVVILTGVAARRRNARAIGEALALGSGKFVAVSAGDLLETTLIAHGSGAVQLSAQEELRAMAVDVGGGTSKIAVCENGEIVDRTVIDVGARLIRHDELNRVTGIEDAGRRLAAESGIEIELGTLLSDRDRQRIAECMAERLFEAMTALPAHADLGQWLRLRPLRGPVRPDVLLFSGGVSEYLHGRETAVYGDLGPALAAAIAQRARAWRVPMRPPLHGIRATVLGASQYTVQASGSTIFVSPEHALPLRNILVLRADLPLEDETLERSAIAAGVGEALRQLDAADPDQAVALCVRWRGSATYGRLDAVGRGILDGLAPYLARGRPLVVVTDRDVGGLIGMHLREHSEIDNPIVSIDGVDLSTLDFIDIGALLESSGAVPVVIKSLVFGAPA